MRFHRQLRVDRSGVDVAHAHCVGRPWPAGDLADRARGQRLTVVVDDAHVECGVHPPRRSGNAAFGDPLECDRERLRHSVHRHDPDAVTLLDAAVHVGRDRCCRDEPQRKLGVPGIRRLVPQHRNHGARAGETRCAAGPYLIGYFARLERRGQHRRRAEKHRHQHRGRCAQMEQRHRAPHHVTGLKLPCGRYPRCRGEQVMPRRCDGLRRSGGAGREEERRQLLRSGRDGFGWGARCVGQRVGQTITDNQYCSHGFHPVDDLTHAGMPLGVGDDDFRARQPQCVDEKLVLVGDVDRGRHRSDPRGTEPEIHPLGAGPREQRDGVTPRDTVVGQHVRGRARVISHLCERHRRSGNGHHHAVAELLSAPVQHVRDRETLDTELRRTDRPVLPPAFRHPPPPGPVRRWRCTRSRSATALRPDRSDAPNAAGRHSRGLPRAPDWASPSTSCSPR